MGAALYRDQQTYYANGSACSYSTFKKYRGNRRIRPEEKPQNRGVKKDKEYYAPKFYAN